MRRDGGGSIWVQMSASLINNPRSVPKPQHIVGICVIICDNLHDQSRLLLLDDATTNTKSNSIPTATGGDQTPLLMMKAVKRVASTSSKIHKIDSLVSAASKKQAKRKDNQVAPIKRVRAQPNQNKISDENNMIKSTTKRQYQMAASLTQAPGGELAINRQCNQTIGSLRRPSDDTCSVVSSITSTSISSSMGQNTLVTTPWPSSVSSCSSSSSVSSSVNSYATSNSIDAYSPNQGYTHVSHHNQSFTNTESENLSSASDHQTHGHENALQTIAPVYQLNQQGDYWQPTCGVEYSTKLPANNCQYELVDTYVQLQQQLPMEQHQHHHQVLSDQYYHRLDELPIETYANVQQGYYTASSSDLLMTTKLQVDLDGVAMTAANYGNADQYLQYSTSSTIDNREHRSIELTPQTTTMTACYVANNQSSSF